MAKIRTSEQFWAEKMKVLDKFTNKITAYVDLYNPEGIEQERKLAAENQEGVEQ